LKKAAVFGIEPFLLVRERPQLKLKRMRHLLIINPNTSGTVSELLQTHAQRAAGPDVRVRTVTARFGAPYIACEASYAVAGHATLDAWAAALTDGQPAPDAVLIGCFGDPGLLALRDTSRVPVTGLAEAAFCGGGRSWPLCYRHRGCAVAADAGAPGPDAGLRRPTCWHSHRHADRRPARC
jgi:hypothetical protein